MKHSMRTHEDTGPWYKQFWAWFVITPLILIVCVCSVLLTISYQLNSDVVNDKYRKEGRMLRTNFDATSFAKELGLQGQIFMNNAQTKLLLQLAADGSVYAPQLTVDISHPIEAKQDLTLVMTEDSPLPEADANRLNDKPYTYIYSAALAKPLSGKRYVRVSYVTEQRVKKVPNAKQKAAPSSLEIWRISGEALFSAASDSSAPAALAP